MRIVATEYLSQPWAGTALRDALCDDGVVLLRLPPIDHAAVKFASCLDALREFFKLDRATKNFCAASKGPGCQVGYMVADFPAGAEMLEAKLRHDPRWPWPNAKVRESVVAARDLLHDTVRACLVAIAAPLGLDANSLIALLDTPVDEHAAVHSAAEYFSRCSNTAMRVWNYWPGGVGNEAHTDNTLLTITPAGTRVGLGIRLYGSHDHVWPEARMRDGDLLLFAGDALSFLTGGRVPPLLHWVEPTIGSPRISMPFFLRPRLNALLDPGDGALQPLRQHQLEANEKNVRWRWPWKLGEYYVCRKQEEDLAAAVSSTAPARISEQAEYDRDWLVR